MIAQRSLLIFRMKKSEVNLFMYATKKTEWNDLYRILENSEELLQATWNMDENAVAEVIEQFHMDYASVIQYNNENALSSVFSI